MLRSFVISLLVSFLVFSGIGTALLRGVSKDITVVDQRYAEAITRLRGEIEGSIENVSNSITSYGDIFRTHDKKIISVRDDMDSQVSALSRRITSTEEGQRQDLAEVISQVQAFSTKLSLVSGNLGSLKEGMVQLQTDFRGLTEVKALEAVESLPDNRLMASALEPTPDLAVSDEASVPGTCPLAALNTDSRRVILRDAIRAAEKKGTHVFNATFDISGDGSTVASQVESQTASAKLKSAVNRYIESLQWNNSEYGFSSCEMQVRLNIN